ncbi:hypothetical protein N7509_009213 [Penicillium cosmopolitanum]|uniref:Uncharacterized protein n=1 Tax=Penicillium cosmopolitanum TaxID=1131564 RepID=A0A9W9VP20_9EURO|nr:uncharacterized protein N7509_009213 [Penicillium cosmopolitanum]KAJ5386672.1 hypothetical protein N7509_009213 [Penicillium cosmopolitanum]
MKFTGIAVSFALVGIVSSAALPPVGLPNMSVPEGAIGGLERTAGGIVTGAAKRQLQYIQPVTESVASSMNGGTGVVGSAVGTVESTVGGAAGTAENSVTGVLGAAKRQIKNSVEEVVRPLEDGLLRRKDPIQPVSEAVASTLNGGTGVVGGAVGTVESTTGGVAGTAENTVSNGLAHVKRQFGNLPATMQQTGTDVLAGLSGNPSGIYGALANLQMIVAAGKLNPSDINDPTGAVQRVIANLAVA